MRLTVFSDYTLRVLMYLALDRSRLATIPATVSRSSSASALRNARSSVTTVDRRRQPRVLSHSALNNPKSSMSYRCPSRSRNSR